MSKYGMYVYNDVNVQRWKAERENADARLEIAKTRECINLLLNQYEPLYSLGIDREALRILLLFLTHHDSDRLERDVSQYFATKPDKLGE